MVINMIVNFFPCTGFRKMFFTRDACYERTCNKRKIDAGD